MNKLTAEKEQFIIANWHTMSATSIGAAVGLSTQTIINYANKANLGKSKTNQSWSDEEVETLKKLVLKYDCSTIAQMMNKSENAIFLKAKKLGLVLLYNKRNWTEDEENYLQDNWGNTTLEIIAGYLHRSPMAIKIKALKMKLGASKDYFFKEILITDLVELLNVSRDIIVKTWPKLGLKIKKKKITNKKSYYCVSLEDLLTFLKDNQNEWNSRFLEENILGTEANWLREKRIRDQINPPKIRSPWTEKEVNTAIDLLIHGHGYAYIATKINHTPKAIAYKMRQLGLQYKLKRFWKGKEIVFLQNNFPTMSMEELVLAMGRTEKAIRYKAESLSIRRLKLK